MNSEEIQYALDRRNHVKLPMSAFGASDNVLSKPIQVGHLTGDVIIEAEDGFAEIDYSGPDSRAIFEYDYTGVQTPPRLFFRNIYSRQAKGGAYANLEVGFLKVIKPNTSPKAIFIDNCLLFNEHAYLIDGPDVSGCDGIQIKNSQGGGSGLIRWRLRDEEKMLFLEISNMVYLTGDRIGPSTDLKNTHGVSFVVYDDENSNDLIDELQGNYAGPLAHRFVNPKGFNWFEHNWNEYKQTWETSSPGCWNTSFRVEDISGNFGMHYIRRYMTPFSWGGISGIKPVRIYGGHDNANASSLVVERSDWYAPSESEYLAGKLYPIILNGWDMEDTAADEYSGLNASGLRNRLTVENADSQPRYYGNTRDVYYNTEFRLSHEPRGLLFLNYEDVVLAQSQKAYGDVHARTTFDGTDVIVTFYYSGTLYVQEEIEVEYLLAGGGGSGGAEEDGTSQQGGGGGAGGFASNFGGTAITLSPGEYPIVVGQGGVFEWGTFGNGTDGGASSFNGITIPGGGGGGGSTDGITYNDGNSGGCGGGGAAKGGVSGGTGSAYGYAGGGSTESAGNPSGGGGGGGAGGAGGDGTYSSVPIGGDGGAGVASLITGTSVTYCEGGGGGSLNNNNQGDGGVETGGWPGKATEGTKERDGINWLGGGGGGGSPYSASIAGYPGNGGHGVVIIRFSSL